MSRDDCPVKVSRLERICTGPPGQNSIFNPIVNLSQNGRLRVKMANLWVTEWLTHFMAIFQHDPDPQLAEVMQSYLDRT